MSTLAGGYSAEKPVDDEVTALFGTPEVLAAVGTKLGQTVTSLTIKAYKTQVVAGLRYKVLATVNESTDVIVSAYKPLPHTGNPLEIQAVETGSTL